MNKLLIPPIQAELTGAVGLGETFKSTPINKQKKFFNKHGFDVVTDNKVLVQMERPFQKQKIKHINLPR